MLHEPESTNTQSGWPAVTLEDLPWDGPSVATAGPGATSAWAPLTSYRAAVPPSIAELRPSLPASIREAADEATRELSRFDAELGPRIAAFAPVLLRSEAASSSQIERLTASARNIFTAELGVTKNRNATQIAANTAAMSAAIELAEGLSAEAIMRVHEVLMDAAPEHTPGQLRKEPVWIGRRGDTPVGAEFVAPHHSRIPILIDDLTEFMRRRDVPSLVHVAIAHAQFETIHPFTDGNGRTGRALAQSLLRARGVTRNVAIPVSAGLLANVADYYAALTAYRAGDPVPIVSAFADAAGHAVWNARILVRDIDRITEAWRTSLSARSDSNAWPLLEIIARRPVIDARTAAEQLGVRTPNVYPPLRTLTDHGILRSKREYQQPGPFWRSEEILQAIDAFAERAGRRRQAQ